MELFEKTFKLQIWDTAGQERFRSLTTAYYRGANGIIIVYDVTDQTSFDNVKQWISAVNTLEGPKILIAGNKMDLISQKVVDTNVAKNFAEEHSALFIELSAKNKINVDKAFQDLVKAIYNGIKVTKTEPKASTSDNKNEILNFIKDELAIRDQEIENIKKYRE